MRGADLEAFLPIAEALEAMGIPYHIGGSVASSAHGVARTTLDVDVVDSQRQWSDVLGLVRTQGPALDLEYLRRWAHELRIADLLARAMREATTDL